jgi:hypothetical protein
MTIASSLNVSGLLTLAQAQHDKFLALATIGAFTQSLGG